MESQTGLCETEPIKPCRPWHGVADAELGTAVRTGRSTRRSTFMIRTMRPWRSGLVTLRKRGGELVTSPKTEPPGLLAV